MNTLPLDHFRLQLVMVVDCLMDDLSGILLELCNLSEFEVVAHKPVLLLQVLVSDPTACSGSSQGQSNE